MGTSGGVSGYSQAQSDSRFYAPSLPADQGFIAWNMPIHCAAAGTPISVAGRIEFARISRVPAGSVTNIAALCSAAGSALTTGQCFGALFTGAGTLVAQTVDQATAWASTGLITMQLSGGPYALAAGDYYVGFWFNGTTGPTFARFTPFGGLATITNAGLSAPNFLSGFANTGLTTTAPGTLGAQTAAGTKFWVALS